jgi:hypothetical protein
MNKALGSITSIQKINTSKIKKKKKELKYQNPMPDRVVFAWGRVERKNDKQGSLVLFFKGVFNFILNVFM